jgi:hypothetical protein
LTSDNGSPVIGFILYRNDKNIGGTTLIYNGSLIPTVSSFLDTTVIAGKEYTYTVIAINEVGNSLLSP